MSLEAWIGAAVVAAAVVALAWLATRRPRGDAGLGLVQQQLDALRAQVAQALAGQSQHLGQELARLATEVGERLRETASATERAQTTIGERLDRASQVFGDVQRGLGELREATQKVWEVGRDVSSLHDILRAPKLRGGLGELLLADLLAQVLPPEHFALQHAFRSGVRVDAVVRLGGGLVPIDAKFPLEDFRRMLDAASDEERAAARRGFAARLRRHVDDIATKYILPDEGTFDFALMYVPAENVYYETIVRAEERALCEYALERKVIPVSPSSFYAYLQAIALGLRGLRIEARAAEVLGQLARVTGDVGRLREELRLVGRHLGNAVQAHAAAERRLERLEAKLGAIEGADEETVPQLALRCAE